MSESLCDDDDEGRNDGYESSYAHPRGTLSCFHLHPFLDSGPVRQTGYRLDQTSVAVSWCQKKRRGIATAAQGS